MSFYKTQSLLPIHQNIHEKLDFFIENKEIPHILFYGTSGSGKKTIVHHFIQKIYKENKNFIKENVMFVNCCHGKGIKFIRDDLKVFAKTNIQSSSGVPFKSIILLNADYLTVDAQSALRRCIELFSYNTRFFIIVENKNKLLNPILSRFCEIYIPTPYIQGKEVNLHQFETDNIMGSRVCLEKETDITEKLCMIRETTPQQCVLIANEMYENGYSCLDIIRSVKKEFGENSSTYIYLTIHYYKLKAEFRCEKMLMFSLLIFFGQGFLLKNN